MAAINQYKKGLGQISSQLAAAQAVAQTKIDDLLDLVLPDDKVSAAGLGKTDSIIGADICGVSTRFRQSA